VAPRVKGLSLPTTLVGNRGVGGQVAKYEAKLSGDFDVILQVIDNEVLNGISATYEAGSDIHIGDTRCAVRVYERYSMTGSNRVSLNVTLVGRADELFLSAIASGGSQAMFLKLN